METNAELSPIIAFRLRQRPPLSQGAFGKLVKAPKGTVSRWEAGKRKIDVDKLPTVVRVTGIPAHRLRPDLAALFLPPWLLRRRKNRARAA